MHLTGAFFISLLIGILQHSLVLKQSFFLEGLVVFSHQVPEELTFQLASHRKKDLAWHFFIFLMKAPLRGIWLHVKAFAVFRFRWCGPKNLLFVRRKVLLVTSTNRFRGHRAQLQSCSLQQLHSDLVQPMSHFCPSGFWRWRSWGQSSTRLPSHCSTHPENLSFTQRAIT